MSTRICENCFAKIGKFIKYRELCAATDIQLRKLVGLPTHNTIDDERQSVVDNVSMNYRRLSATKRILPDSNVNDIEP